MVADDSRIQRIEALARQCRCSSSAVIRAVSGQCRGQVLVFGIFFHVLTKFGVLVEAVPYTMLLVLSICVLGALGRTLIASLCETKTFPLITIYWLLFKVIQRIRQGIVEVYRPYLILNPLPPT